MQHTDFDLERFFAERQLALEPSAVSGLAALAAARVAGDIAGLQQQFLAAGPGATSTRVQRAGAIAVVPLLGLIVNDRFLAYLLDGTTPDDFLDALREAVADPTVTDVLLLVNSPGGVVDLIRETATEIRRLRGLKPITAIARTVCCSAAFWLAAQADEVIVTPSATIGSVGVFTIHYDASQLNARIGVKPTYVYAGKYKVEENEDEPLADDAKAFLQKRVDETAAAFIADLARGRGVPEAKVRKDFGEGRAFGADEAVRRGMADRVATIDETIARLASSPLSTRRHARLHQHRQAQRDRDLLATTLALLT